MIYTRWMVNANREITKHEFFDMLPPLLKQIVSAMAHKKMKQSLWLQGVGRHTEAEIYASGKSDVSALSDYLGIKAYFGGETPASLDTTAYAFLANILIPEIDSPLRQHMLSLRNLPAYCQRMKTRYYPA